MAVNPKRSFRILTLVLVNIALLVALLEVGAYLLYPVLLDDAPTRQGMRQGFSGASQEEPAATADDSPAAVPLWMENHMLHPYTGFAGDPTTVYEGGRLYTEYGFPGPPLPTDPEGDDYIVAITGGSVAMSFYYNGTRPLRSALKKAPEFEDKTIRFVCLALQGFKQPQQFMALSYFLARGRRFDMVINLDGFNEVVLPMVDNFPAGVAPIYPRSWNLYARNSLSGEALRLVARREAVRQERQRIRRVLSQPVLRWSNTALVVVALLDQSKENALNILGARLREVLQGAAPDPVALGPTYDDPVETEDAALARSVAIWQRCSLQMHRLCSANGMRYAHFLQPNQYVPESKEFTEGELSDAYRDGPYRDAAAAGYPLLIDAGDVLREAGVLFEDLTDIYKNVAERIYVDDCCHVNALGNRLLAERIAAAIREHAE